MRRFQEASTYLRNTKITVVAHEVRLVSVFVFDLDGQTGRSGERRLTMVNHCDSVVVGVSFAPDAGVDEHLSGTLVHREVVMRTRVLRGHVE